MFIASWARGVDVRVVVLSTFETPRMILPLPE